MGEAAAPKIRVSTSTAVAEQDSTVVAPPVGGISLANSAAAKEVIRGSLIHSAAAIEAGVGIPAPKPAPAEQKQHKEEVPEKTSQAAPLTVPAKQEKPAGQGIVDGIVDVGYFILGLGEGFLGSIRDLLVGLVQVGALFVKLLLVLSDPQAMVKVVQALGSLKWDQVLGAIKAIPGALLKTFSNNWNNPDKQKACEFRGEVIGYAVAEILLAILTAGIFTEVKWVSFVLGKLGKAGEVLLELVNRARGLLGKEARAEKYVEELERLEKVKAAKVEGKGIEAEEKAKSITVGIESKYLTSEGTFINSERAEIPINKITKYILNSEHPIGANKAKVIKSALGFDEKNYQGFLVQIEKGIINNKAIPGKLDKYGQRFKVYIKMTGPKGNATVLTAWIFKTDSSIPQLVSAYIPK